MQLITAFLPIVFLLILLILNVLIFGDGATAGPNQLALLLSAFFTILISSKQTDFKAHLKAMSKNISIASPAILILLFIGAMVGTWMLSGIVPALIYYGLDILSPKYFLVSACVICTVVSISTGSSWSTTGTIGIALLGVAKAMQIPVEYAVGAIISGAYFGDKLSPLSDTTNLSAAMADVDLFEHIKYMLFTTIPSVFIALGLFFFMGLGFDQNLQAHDIHAIQTFILTHFNITPMLFLVPLLMLYLIYKKVPTLAVICIAFLLGGCFALGFQKDLIYSLNTDGLPYLQLGYKTILSAATTGFSLDVQDAAKADLVSASGMSGMLSTIWLILCAMCFGATMEASGYLRGISKFLIARVESFFGLVSATSLSCLFFNFTASDQYLAVVVPGKMFKQAFKDRGYAGVNLSRTLEDSGTVTSVLVPWNTCGAYHAALFGVATWAYLPFCFFNLLSPLMTLLYAAFRIKIKKHSS